MSEQTSENKTYFLSENTKIKAKLSTIASTVFAIISVVGMIIKLQVNASDHDKKIEKLEEKVERIQERLAK